MIRSMTSCSCSRLCIGRTVTETRNWNPDCALHGVGSEWHDSPEQVLKRQETQDRARELMGLAREARLKARGQ